MAATARSAIITGPAKVSHNSLSCHTQGNITVREVLDTFPVVVDAYGTIDYRVSDATVSVGFTPDGRWSASIQKLLFPYIYVAGSSGFVKPGTDALTSSDLPLTIHDSNDHLHTVIAACVRKMPSITLGPTRTMLGDCEFIGVRGSAADWNDANKLYTQAGAGGTLTDSAFTIAQIKTQIYSGIWTGITGFSTAFFTVDGWTVDAEVQLAPIVIDEVGTVKFVVQGVTVMAKCKPLGVTYANITAALKSQGTGGSRGRSLAAAGADLTITGEDTSSIIVLKNANLKEGGFMFGSTVVRDGELAWLATVPFSIGAPSGAVMTLA